MELKGSETEANLRRAFAGEACARSRCDLFAEAARKEGWEQLAAFFEETARNEQAHARMWLRALGGPSGPGTMPKWPGLPGRRAFRSWPPNSRGWPGRSGPTRSGF